MTREEAYRLAMRACEETWNEKTCKQIREALEQKWIPVSDPLKEFPKDRRIWVTYKYVDNIFLVDDIYYDMTEWSNNAVAKNAVAYMYYYTNEPEPYIKESEE